MTTCMGVAIRCSSGMMGCMPRTRAASLPLSESDMIDRLRAAKTATGVGKVWGSAWYRAGVAGRDDMMETWQTACRHLRAVGDHQRAGWAETVARREVEAWERRREVSQARRPETRWYGPAARRKAARHAEGRTARGPRHLDGTPAGGGKTPQFKITRSFKVAANARQLARLDVAAAVQDTDRAALVRRYLAEGLGVEWGPLAGEWAPGFRAALDAEAVGHGERVAETVRRLIWEGLGRDGFAPQRTA